MNFKNRRQKAQSALEYMLLVTVVAVVIFVAIKPSKTGQSVLNRAQEASTEYYNSVTQVIMGKNPNPINGGWCAPKPGGYCECACPAPAFGGAYCVDGADPAGVCKAAVGGSPAYCGDRKCDHGSETGEPGHPLDPADPLTTCFVDCAYAPNCDLCSTMIPSAACGVPCPITRCSATQTCMTSNCPSSCPEFRQTCQVNPLLCTATCRCDPTPADSQGVCGATAKCGPYNMLPTEKCFKYASCAGPCSDYEMFVTKADPSCVNCSDGIKNGTETDIDCGGTCKACCGNGVLNGTEECDDGNKTNGDGCSNLCKLEGTCQPTGNYACGGSTPGRDDRTNVVCIISRACDPGETITSCPADCGCQPNGNCLPDQGRYICGAVTPGHDENCPGIACNIPQRCDPGEDCTNCSSDCATGVCIPDAVSGCTANTPGHYSNCPTISCTMPAGCNAGYDTCTSCPSKCGICGCTGLADPNASLCTGADQNVVGQVPWTLTNTCDGTKCQYKCKSGYVYVSDMNWCDIDRDCPAVTLTASPPGQPQQCGTVNLPQTKWADPKNRVVTVPCPGSCSGGDIEYACYQGNWSYYRGGCGPTSCPAKTGTSGLCGAYSVPAGPNGAWVPYACGALCNGTAYFSCNNGTYTLRSETACQLKTVAAGAPCSASTYNTPCGNTIDVPAMTSGQTINWGCTGGCTGGLISASCINGVANVHNNCQYCGDYIKNGSEACDGDVVACSSLQVPAGYKTCKPDCSGYGNCIP